MDKQISVVMTVKNGQEFIGKAIRSVLDQTHLPVEIVIVDDGSVDDTKQIVNLMAVRSIIPIHFFETGGIGRAKALNLAVGKANGSWIANLDVDDYWYPDKLQAQLELLKKEPCARIVITESQIIIKDHEESIKKTPLRNYSSYVVLPEKAFYYRNPVNHSSVLFSKPVFYEVGQYDGVLDKQIDFDLWIKFMTHGYGFYQISSKLTVKVLHNNQSFEAVNIVQYRWSSMKMKYHGLLLLKAKPIYYLFPFFYFILGLLPRRVKTVLSKYH